jgi:hypothetical protein
MARRKAVVYEILSRQDTRPEREELLARMETGVSEQEWATARMCDLLRQVDLGPEMVWRYAPQSLGLTLVGGASERLV